MRSRESFHLSVKMFIQTLPNDKFQQLSTVYQVPDGSLEGCAAPRILHPERAQV